MSQQPQPKVYAGLRFSDGTPRVTVTDTRACFSRPLPLRLDLANLSPTGFDWGNDSDGARQLALAVLADVCGFATLALQLHRAFTLEWAALVQWNAWTLTAQEVIDWVAAAALCEVERGPCPDAPTVVQAREGGGA